MVVNNDWKPINDFAIKYGLSRNTVNVQVWTHKGASWHKKEHNRVYINEKFFIDKQNRRVEAMRNCINYYFILLDGFGLKNSAIVNGLASTTGRSTASWGMWVSNKLFQSQGEQSILNLWKHELLFEFEEHSLQKIYDLIGAGETISPDMVSLVQDMLIERAS